ncbi:MAG: DUF885 family protein [Bryobacteraceae bacterium]
MTVQKPGIVLAAIVWATVLLAQSGAGRRELPTRRPPVSPYQAPPVRELLGAAPSDLSELLERYGADLQILKRFYDVPVSSATDRALQQFFQSWRTALQQVPFDSLPQEGRIDYLLFRNKLDQEIQLIDQHRKRTDEIAVLVPFLPAIVELKEARQRVELVDSAAAAARLEDIARQIDELSRRLNDPTKAAGLTVSKTIAYRAAKTVDYLRGVLKNWFDFYDGYDPVFTWWVREPYKTTSAALEKYASLVREKQAGVKPGDRDTIVGDPVGREALITALQHELIPYMPEDLIQIARHEFAWCDAEMLRASRALGYGDDWRKAVEHVKSDFVKPGEQPSLILGLTLEAIEYVQKHDMVTVPQLARDTWRMEMMSPERQRMNPFFLGGEVLQVSYPTDGMTEEQKLMSMRGNNIHFARATVFHEVIPGHFLQLFMADRYRRYRRMFDTPFSVEGWALYWEMVLWDRGFPQTPEDRIGMLVWRMHRCARIIFSLSFHLGKMKAPECVDFLVNRVGFERENAAAEVRRSFESDEYGPLYQAAYMLGALQFRALRSELTGRGKMTERDFHDAILKLNAIPVELVRASLTQQPLTNGFVSRWRFYDLAPRQ